jgi:hypothetical protein
MGVVRWAFCVERFLFKEKGDSRRWVLVSHDDDVLRLAAEGQMHAGLAYIPRDRSVRHAVQERIRLASTSSREEMKNVVGFL